MIYAPRGRHSEKPEAAWHVIETVSRSVLPGVIGCEWNARRRRLHWAAYGALDGEDKPLRYEQMPPARLAYATASSSLLIIEEDAEQVLRALEDGKGQP
jgi:hypothetical protein